MISPTRKTGGPQKLHSLATKLHALAIKADQDSSRSPRGQDMIKAYTTAAVLLVLAPSAALAQRAGDAALGAVAGAVVLGPIGAVAGAFVGYTAGPSISRSWGLDRSRSSRHRRHSSKDNVRGARAEAARAEATGPGDSASTANARVATSRSEGSNSAPRRAPSAKTSFPPVQTLD
jgi:hypothetical protein